MCIQPTIAQLVASLLNSHSIQKMRRPPYIPTTQERKDIVNQLLSSHPEQKEKGRPRNQGAQKKKVLCQGELEQLLHRLTKTTQRQHRLEINAEKMLVDNEILKKKRLEGEKVQNRLIEYGKKNLQKKQQLGVLLENDRKVNEQRDIPQISEKGKKVKQKVIDKRLQELLQQRESRRRDLENKHTPSFKPKIDPYSEFINELDNYGDLFSRMHEKQGQAAERQQDLAREMEQREREKCTYRPEMNPRSKEIASRLPQRSLSEYKKPTKHSTITISEEDQQECSFVPQINPHTQALLSNKQNYDSNCFRRLYGDAHLKNDKLQKKRAMTSDSFKPSLNSRSLRIMSQTPRPDKSRNSVNSFENCQQIKVGINATDRTKADSVRGEWDADWKKTCMRRLGGKGRSAAFLL